MDREQVIEVIGRAFFSDSGPAIRTRDELAVDEDDPVLHIGPGVQWMDEDDGRGLDPDLTVPASQSSDLTLEHISAMISSKEAWNAVTRFAEIIIAKEAEERERGS